MAFTERWKSTDLSLDSLEQARQFWKTMVVLFKLRVVSLLLLSAFGGAALGIIAGGQATLGNMALLGLTGLLSSAGASAINQYLERDRDSSMKRTAKRPLATGSIKRPWIVLVVALAMVFGSAGISIAAGLPRMALWLVLGAAIYVGIYTVWLKPRTVLNIVIGGAAGSCAVLAGGAAVGADMTLGVWLMAALVFVWTPVHFWALALAYRDDYRNASFPMLPAQVSAEATAWWIAFHAVLTLGTAIAIAFTPTFDPISFGLLTLSGLPLIRRTAEIVKRPCKRTAFPLFHASNIYLAAVIGIAMVSLFWR